MRIKYKIENCLTDKIRDFIRNYGFEIPSKPILYLVAYDENDEIIGLCVLQNWVVIEPFISKNPMVGYNLYQKADILSYLYSDKQVAFTDDENVEKILQKLGFEKLNYNIWRKKWE